ncbi:MAG: SDR family NAD(P)-dependent oxidoreductase [Thermoguttaceae bacterium]|nr:SDR family NAD(P)-dependent oxidoreductase [Thermoguttaceae bacterium]
MKRDLKNARIILTGASSGIGRQLAIQAAKAGAKLVLTARRAQLLEEVKAQIESETGGNCAVELVVGDITLQETREAVVNRCVEAFGGVDVLVNNAGAAASGLFETNTPERLERVMALNLTAPVEMIRLVLPLMKKWKEASQTETTGKPIPPMIVNLSSIVGLRGVTHYSEYCAGKAAIRAFSQSIRTEFHRYGIDVLVVCPGSTDTGFFTDYIENTGEPTWPHHKRVTPEYVAKQMLKAIQKGKMEIIPFFLGKVMKGMDYFFPKSLERAMVFFSEHPGVFK